MKTLSNLKANFTKPAAVTAVTAMTVAGSSVGVLCSDTPTVAITSEMLSPIVDSIVANIGVVMPIGIAIFGVMVGIPVVIRILRTFIHS